MANSPHNAILSRRTLMAASPAAALVAMTIPPSAMAQSETLYSAKEMEALQRPLAILGRALADSRTATKWTTSKTGETKSAKITIWLDGTEGAEIMGAMMAGVVFAGIHTPEELIAMIENCQRKTA